MADLRRLRERYFGEGAHEAALQVATEVARRDPGRESYLRQGMLLREVGRYREALDTLRDALRFGSGARYLLADIHLHIAHTWLLLGRRKRVGEAVRRSYALRLKPRSAFNFHMACGNYLLSKRDFRAALLEYLQAEKTAPNAMGRGRAAINQGLALMRQWDTAAALGPLDRSIRILKKAGHAAELAIARAARAAIHGERGQHRRALGMFLRAGGTFRRLGKVDREAEVLSNAAFHAGALGQWARSRAILDRAIGLASATGQQAVLSCAFAQRALACAYGGDPDIAVSNLAQAQRLMRGKRDWISTLHVYRAEARLAALAGRWTETFRVSRRAERFAAKLGDALRVVEFRRLRAEAEGHLGRKKASLLARASAERLDRLVRSRGEQPFEQVAFKLAAAGLAVLIQGDPGTDKVEVARGLHRSGARSRGPCIVVPCEQLTFPASDLYGHAQGAWSGASRSARGFVHAARGGTLILDGVDGLTPSDQRILMPLLEGRARVVGGTQEEKLDLRLVATCTVLDRLIPEVRSRLEGAILRLPSLRDQRPEIPHLVARLIGGRRRITPDAVVEMSRHPWDGNLIQLRSMVDRLVALSEGIIGRKLVRRLLGTMQPPAARKAGRNRIRHPELMLTS